MQIRQAPMMRLLGGLWLVLLLMFGAGQALAEQANSSVDYKAMADLLEDEQARAALIEHLRAASEGAEPADEADQTKSLVISTGITSGLTQVVSASFASLAEAA
ncbi:MAG TPA: hypothetical protein ENM98_00505, partial [Halothiobacillaceae bacterium]|nr:hypothetical protein [Halothiobacillaceae bacterium]